MKSARIVVLFVALGAAGGAAMLAKSVIPGAPAPVADAGPKLKTEKVLVASKDISLGAKVVAGDLSWQDWPASSLSPHFITQGKTPDGLSKAVGAIARMPVLGGEPVNMNKLVQAGEGGFMSAILPRGMRAVSTKISPETGAGGFILPNDRVDVILTKKEKNESIGGSETFNSETILANVRVLAIDQTVKEEDGRQVVVGKTATLELAPEQAEVLTLAEQMGEMSLALRSLADAAPGSEDDRVYRSGSIKVVKFGVASQVMTSR
ncbi:MAG TPA: Flp pilus assembly protein CpaB [Hyphomicrobiales bacterium]|nr:Flp pilus assembly protein CpaB [Rhodobiaceae bacterium]HXK54502.1 Flp pilus assembly protein CpaB [Hyphomicrobiales bacterium]